MKKISLLLLVPVMPLIFLSCNTETKTADTNIGQSIPDSTAKKDSTVPALPSIGDNSANSLDWPGTYKGTLPCADCEGIETTITIGIDSVYTLTTKYLGKKNSAEVAKTGTFTWNKEGGAIRLDGITNAPNQYQVAENMLVQLDMQGKKITGDIAALYQLIKQPMAEVAVRVEAVSLTDTYWKLTQMMGKAITGDESSKEVFMKINGKENKVNGNAGCNNFFGTYEINNNYRIRFSKMGSTMMACPKMTLERDFLQLLEKADSYIIKDNKLQLIRARMAPLAVFEGVPGK